MKNIYEVDPTELIEKTSEELKKVETIKPPEWAIFVRTGHFKERPPVRNDWWYVRTASVLRKIALIGPIGTSKLRTLYGGKKNRGVRKSRFYKASGSVLRKILQQLEKAEFVKKIEKEDYKGRAIAPKGVSFLEKVAGGMIKEKPQPVAKPKAVKKVEAKPKEVKPKAVEAKKEVKPAVKKVEAKPKEVKPKPVEAKKEVKPAVKEEKKAEVKKPEVKK